MKVNIIAKSGGIDASPGSAADSQEASPGNAADSQEAAPGSAADSQEASPGSVRWSCRGGDLGRRVNELSHDGTVNSHTGVDVLRTDHMETSAGIENPRSNV